MKYNLDDLLKGTYKTGERPSQALNRNVLQMVKECDNMKQDEMKNNYRSKIGGKYYSNCSRTKRFAKVAAVFAVVLLMGSSVVYAGIKSSGIKYFWELRGKEMSEETTKLVDDNPIVEVTKGAGETDILDFEVSSVLCDSRYVVAVIDVAVKDADKYFLVTGTTDLTEPVSSMSIGIESDKSVGEYCQAEGLQPVQIHTKLDSQSKKYVQIISGDNKQDGTDNGSIMICGERLTEDKSFTMGINTQMVLCEGEKHLSSYEGDTLQVEVEDNSSEQTAYYRVDENEKYRVPGTTITLKEVKLTTTEVGTYSEINYIDKRDSEDVCEWIELCDENGDAIEWNGVGCGQSEPKGNYRYLQKDCYKSIGLPEEIYLSIDEFGKVVKLKRVE